MASRTQRTRQRNETRRKNRKAQKVQAFALCGLPYMPPESVDTPCRDPLLASLGMTQARADELLAEAVHAASKPCVLMGLMPVRTIDDAEARFLFPADDHGPGRVVVERLEPITFAKDE